jgi:hypothetical protein
VSGDYKYEMQMRAEELAEEEYGVDFYALSQDQQFTVFERARQDWIDARVSKADSR